MSKDVTIPQNVTLILKDKKANMILLGLPTEDQYEDCYKLFQHYNVKDYFIATTFEPSLEYFTQRGMQLHHIEWEDGNAPPDQIIQTFLEVFLDKDRKSNDFIAVSCKRGYGRAPTLAAIALITKGLAPAQTLTTLRKYNPRFITERQKAFLLKWKPPKTEKGDCRI